MSKINLIQAINLALEHAMEDDPEVLVLGEDVADREGGGVVGITKGLSSRFGDDRVKSTPISETGFMAESDGDFEVGSRVWLILPGRDRANALVRWIAGKKIGAEFAEPIDLADLTA